MEAMDTYMSMDSAMPAGRKRSFGWRLARRMGPMHQLQCAPGGVMYLGAIVATGVGAWQLLAGAVDPAVVLPVGTLLWGLVLSGAALDAWVGEQEPADFVAQASARMPTDSGPMSLTQRETQQHGVQLDVTIDKVGPCLN